MSEEKEQREFDDELAKTMKRMVRKQRPRYGDGPRATGVVKLYRRRSLPRVLEVNVSYDIIERMYQLRDSRPPSFKMPGYVRNLMRAEFVPFKDPAVPALLMRLDARFYQRGPKLYRGEKSWRYKCVLPCTDYGVKEGMLSLTPEYVWWKERKGMVIIFPDEYMQYEGKKVDVKALFKEELGE